MKPLFRLPASAAALAGLFLLGVGLTRAADPDPAAQQAAEKLLTAMHTEQMLDGNLKQMLTLVDRFGQSVKQTPNVTPEQIATLDKAADEARDTIRKELGYSSLKGDFVKAYAEAFSPAELKDLTAFYTSPVGQKFADKQSSIVDEIARNSQQKARTVMMGVVTKLREVAQKTLPPPPAPEPDAQPPAPPAPGAAPVPPPPGAPGVPPVPPAPGAPGAPVPPPGAAPVPPTPPVSAATSPVSVMPTPLPSATGTPSAQ